MVCEKDSCEQEASKFEARPVKEACDLVKTEFILAVGFCLSKSVRDGSYRGESKQRWLEVSSSKKLQASKRLCPYDKTRPSTGKLGQEDDTSSATTCFFLRRTANRMACVFDGSNEEPRMRLLPIRVRFTSALLPMVDVRQPSSRTANQILGEKQ